MYYIVQRYLHWYKMTMKQCQFVNRVSTMSWHHLNQQVTMIQGIVVHPLCLHCIVWQADSIVQ
ncbi:MAG: hypothetical protein EBU46_08885 [Nitrosomonadaceae bacterium]|nr:hypothetical protein [Nitrosomonadaceae bacterium]